jgi:hypothetical protein
VRYPRLPEPPAPEPGATLQGRGLEILSFVLVSGVTATVDTRDLELADYAFPLAVANHDVSPLAVERLSDARSAITAALRVRAQDAASAAQAGPGEAIAPAPDVQGGALVPVPQRPTPRPPQAPAVRPPVSPGPLARPVAPRPVAVDPDTVAF